MAIQTTIKKLTKRIDLPSLRGKYSLFNSYISRMRIVNRTGVGASFLLGLLLLLVITPLYNVTGVEDSEAATSYNPSESSITFSTGRNTATISGTPTTSGKFISSSDDEAQIASFDVTTNNATGYTLSIASNKSDTSLTNGSTTLSALTADTTTNAGITATVFNSDTYNNMWGYMPSKVSSTANTTKFYPMTNTARTIDTTSCANDTPGCSSTSNNYTIKLGARVSYAQAAGTYTVASGTSFILTAVGNPANYNITYNQNTTDIVSNLPSSTGTMSTTSQSIALSSNSVSRSGYNFLGYCTVATADQRDDVTGPSACSSVSGTYYAKGANFYINETTANITNLYAIWGLAVTNLGNLQDLAYSSCTTSLSKATDTRDGSVYYIQRLADGNCWMLDNLRLDLVNTSLATLQGKTNATNTELNYLKNGGGSTSDKYATSGVITWPSSSYSYSVPWTATSGTGNNGNWTVDTAVTSYGSGSGEVGAYYNYCAASAGTYCYGNGTDYGLPSGNATADICPSGWRMPTGSSSGEYQTLCTTAWGSACSDNMSMTATNAKSIQTVLSTPLSGIYSSGQASNQGSNGYFWSSTYRTANYMYGLHHNASNVYPHGSLYRYNGFSVRCILTPSYNITISISGGASGVVINGTTYTNGQTASLQKGREYTISGVYDSNYEFSSWSVGSGGTLGSASSASTTLTITSATTLTLTGKASCQTTVGGSMQNFNPCPILAIGTKGSLTDSRGGTTKTYTVAKLADGKWWMTSNLNLPGGTRLTSQDSNITAATYNLPNSMSSPNFSSNTTALVYNTGSTTCANNSPCYSYYSYIAATAGTGSSINSAGHNATGSICPKHWRLPTATTSNASAITNSNWKTGDLYALATAYGTNLEDTYQESTSTFYANAGPGTTPNFVLAGAYNDSPLSNGGLSAYYWTSTSAGDNYAYSLWFTSSYVRSADGVFRREGQSVRCLFES